ncbi:MAG: hypothetical protein Q4P32_10175, partial [Micrococcales bacterium]|nr:hypothetical protein [Micrococcales bacterium]
IGTQVAQVPAMPTLAVGILLLVVASAIQWREVGSNRDPVQPPAEADGVGRSVEEPTPVSAALTVTLMYPVVTLVFIAVNRLIAA